MSAVPTTGVSELPGALPKPVPAGTGTAQTKEPEAKACSNKGIEILSTTRCCVWGGNIWF